MSDHTFVHLHVHTEYSLLDGLSRIKKLVERAKALGMPALAITDHGTMFGVIEFYRACKDAGIKPIIGCEAYLAPNGMHDRLSRDANHLLLLARNETGYKNLLRIASDAQLKGYYYRPRIDWQYLETLKSQSPNGDLGLVATSGCLAAQIPQELLVEHYDKARSLIDAYRQMFGRDHFFLELQPHNIDELTTVNKWLIETGKRDAVPFVATNDVHYVSEADYNPHDTLLCIQTGALKKDDKRLRMSGGNTYYLKSQAEMWSAFGDLTDGTAISNTLLIAEMCDLDLNKRGYHLPVFPVPEGFTSDGYLRHLCYKGLAWRFGERASDSAIRDRLDYELNVVHKMGFDTYFLIVWDLCEFARSADIWWNVRGSGAGSLAAYCLGITNIDPLQNNLLFERFLNPGRVSMPDIDLDYPDDQRGRMIEYAVQKYGEDRVAAIITFGTLGAKAAIRDVGRVLDVDPALVNQAARLIPTEPKPKKVREYIDDIPDLKKLIDSTPALQEVAQIAEELQGVSRHASTHAAGIIIADQPLVEYLPLHRQTKGGDDGDDGIALKQVTQFDMETCESIGLLKVDFLGLSTLSIMRRACELIAKHHGVVYTMENIPYRPNGDAQRDAMLAQAFELLSRGDTVGVFQVESSGMQQMLREMRPFKFEHIVAGISLYRPGPMEYIPEYNARMHGEKEETYLHEKLRTILGETYGIMVYQEQIMQIGQQLFGYSLGEADLMRRAVSKKKKEDLLKHREIFLKNGPELDPTMTTEIAEKIFADIEFFANYGFNKSHAADYAVMTVQTAFLKAHYPAEYMAALLSVYFDDAGKVTTLLRECRRLDIPILPPDVNASQLDFDIQHTHDGKRGIRFGLAAIKNAGVGALQHLLDERECGGQFASLEDLCHRVDLRQVGKRAVESLIKVGALDSLGGRKALIAALDRIVTYSAEYHKIKVTGQMSMFGTPDSASGALVEDDLLRQLPDGEETSLRDMLDWERELLGIYLSQHPVDPILDQIADTNISTTHDLAEMPDDKEVRLVGLIAGLRRIPTKNKDMMAVATLEDRFGKVDVVLFPKSWRQYEPLMNEGKVVVVSGKYDTSRGDPQIVCNHVTDQIEIMRADTSGSGFTPPPRAGRAPAAAPVPQNSISGAVVYDDDDALLTAEPDFPPFEPTEIPPDESSYEIAPPAQPTGVPAELPPYVFEDAKAPEAPPRTLVIRFTVLGDAARDDLRRNKLMGHLKEHPGSDRVEILLVEQGSVTYRMTWKGTTGIDASLLKKLNDMSGIAVSVAEQGEAGVSGRTG